MEFFDPPNKEYPPPKPGEPPLHRAAREGDHAAIRCLIDAGEDVQAIFDIGLDPGARVRLATPLMIAAGSGDGATAATVSLLMELGADPKVMIGESSAATFAIEGLGWNYRPGGDSERLRLLLAAESPLPSGPQAMNKLLCNAASLGDSERLRVLLAIGMHADGFWDASAAAARDQALEEFLFADARDQSFLAEIPEEIRDLVAESTQAGASKYFKRQRTKPYSHEIPLFCAAESGNADCVRLLLQAGANGLKRDHSEQTAMFYAGSVEVVEVLIRAGLGLEDTNEYGWTPLRECCTGGEEAIPRLLALIAAGANIHATYDHGYTIFMSAVASMDRCPEILRILVQAGANPHAVSELGYNAFHAAVDVDGEANLEESVRDTLGYLKELGVDIEQRNKRGLTPLARAIRDGTQLEVEVLCELGADPNAVCPDFVCGPRACEQVELPLLFHAISQPSISESLLKAGASPLAQDPEGCTPLMHNVYALCDDASDRNAAYQSFFKGLQVMWEGRSLAATFRDAYIQEAKEIIHEYVEQFAAAIPFQEGDEYLASLREEQKATIILLCAYEAWVRWNEKGHES